MFKSIEQLPPTIRAELPTEAQELYRARYNRVVEKATMAKARSEEDVAAEAHQAAMLRVEEEFRRDAEGRWQRRPIGEEMEDTGPDDGR
ncbi:ChaB family protein [Thioalkalivibrio sp. XN8]|uniref:ChaB family protein n=1 Tax=Thioalkalivibrio sp. XN8 TaxID=2712863 RepID=UPI0013EBD9E7|nr:ChaB family protein [Thioalkalivibrio sp. XN8]NGP54480.1 hypothetical protein [Thioalkalivibrio sp. XN8]